jgi:AraC-like DNA-binding protein
MSVSTNVVLIVPRWDTEELLIGGSRYLIEEGTVAVIKSGDPLPAGNMQIYAVSAQSLSEGGCYTLSAQDLPLLDRLRLLEQEDPRAILLAQALLLCCTPENKQEPSAASRDGALFSRAVAYLKDRAAEQVSVNELAEYLEISLSHLKRIFARFAGKGAKEYFNDLKMEYAKELLVAGRSVTQTAEEAGFANQAYFSAAFKKTVGQSPKQFSMQYAQTGAPVSPKAPKKKKQQPQNKRDLPSYLL